MMKRCGTCGQQKSTDNIFTKTVSFRRTSELSKIVRQRVIALICSDCLEEDEHFNTASYSSSRNAAEAKVRADAVRAETLSKIREAGF